MEKHICCDCNKGFSRASNLRKHRKGGQCVKKLFCCDDCKHRYSKRKSLMHHVCRKKVEKLLIVLRKEGLKKGKSYIGFYKNMPTSQEITDVREYLDNKPWYTPKAISTIAKGSLWYEKAEDSDYEDDSDSDPSEDGGDSDFDDDDERSALTSTYEQENGPLSESDTESEMESEKESDQESDHDQESEESEEESEFIHPDGQKYNKAERRSKIERNLNEIKRDEDNEIQEILQENKPRPIEIGFPNVILSQGPLIQPIKPLTRFPKSQAGPQPKQESEPVVLNILKRFPKPDPASIRRESSAKMFEILDEDITDMQSVTEVKENRKEKKNYIQNVIIPSGRKKHYYESDDSDEERGYMIQLDKENRMGADSDSDNPSEIYVLSAEDLKRQKEGWIPCFEHKGYSLEESIALLEKTIDEDKLNGKYVIHPIPFRRQNDNDSDNKLDIPLICTGNYVYTIHALRGNQRIYDTHIHINKIASSDDFLDASFRLLKKLYFDGRKKSEIPIKVTDVRRCKLEFLDYKKIWVTDIKGIKLGKILCDNLMDTYALANSRLSKVINNLESWKDKEYFLDMFRINISQENLRELRFSKNQVKLTKRLIDFISSLSEDEVIE